MKKLLLTTSALTLLAGAAVADVNLSGYGRVGISSTSGKSSQYTRMRVNISGSSTTDGGLTMTAATRYQSTTDANKSSTGVFSGVQASISNGTMGLTVGNAPGAVAQAAGVWGCSAVMWSCHDLTDDRWGYNWATRSSGGAGPDVVRLDMALGGASVSVSGGNGNDMELGVSMPMGGGTVGVGYDTDHDTAAVEAAEAVVHSATAPASAAVEGSAAIAKAAITQINYSGTMGGLGVGVKLAQQNGKNAYMASVTAPAGSGSVYVYAGKQLPKGTDKAQNNYGLRYNQSLGGGASMHVGANSLSGTTTIGAGVQFGF